MPPKKINRMKRQPKQIKTLVSTRDFDVGFGAVPISRGALQQSQNQQILNTIGNTNQLLGRLKAQQVSLENELERVKKQSGVVVDKDILEVRKMPVKAGFKDDFSQSGVAQQERIKRLKELEKSAKPTREAKTPGGWRSILGVEKDTSIEDAQKIVQERISMRQKQVIEAEERPIVRPSYLQPLAQVTRTRETSEMEINPRNVSRQVLEQINEDNVDLRGFGLRN